MSRALHSRATSRSLPMKPLPAISATPHWQRPRNPSQTSSSLFQLTRSRPSTHALVYIDQNEPTSNLRRSFTRVRYTFTASPTRTHSRSPVSSLFLQQCIRARAFVLICAFARCAPVQPS
eukprot:270383-Pleurochrysis_carterae.AAC.1